MLNETPLRRRPNVVLVITDDQGYGDLGCTGNPWIQTPHIDQFFQQAARLTDFHVSPLCTPTRGALMSGRNPLRNGAWATCWGRSILGRNETTMADVFSANGYRTGLFGKWHLGDNYPYRPQDRGFETVVAHKGGGVGQTPDFWGNNYFNDTYFANGTPQAFDGYCTDVWFDAAMDFISDHRREPFFCYISTNAPHSPYLVADEYTDPYRGNPHIPVPAFYGMITNIDQNFGRLRRHLEELGIEQNTILIFMTDNGTSAGWSARSGQGYNARMRGAKGSYYDGGHRVPFFVRWPDGGIGGGKDLHGLAAHVDVLPTFIELCGLNNPAGTFDGISIAEYLQGRGGAPADRNLFIQFRQNTEPPEKWDNAVINQRWRLIRGIELYDIHADPGQNEDVAASNPEVVAQMRAAHEDWWQQIAPNLQEYHRITLGHAAENPTRLDSMDVQGDVAWNQCHVAAAVESSGCWAVDVHEAGDYRISLRRWPRELGLPFDAVLDQDQMNALAPYVLLAPAAVKPVTATLELFGSKWVQQVDASAQEAVFAVRLEQSGATKLEAWFEDIDGNTQGAYYVYVERL